MNAIKRMFALILFVLGIFVCACDEEVPDKIVFGQATSLTGIYADLNTQTTQPVYRMWIDEINAQGGLYIEKYGDKIPVELLQYDDQSNIDVLKVQLEKLIREDKVDFLLPPVTTEHLEAAAVIANKYGYIIMGGAGGALELKEVVSGLPYFFNVLNFADTQIPVFANILEEVGVKSVGILMMDLPHGYEYVQILTPLLASKNIDTRMIESYSETDPKIATRVKEILMEANSYDVDAFISFSYPNGTMAVLNGAMEIGYNPNLMLISVGPNWEAFQLTYGDAYEGLMGPGAWNVNSVTGATDGKTIAQFAVDFHARWTDGKGPNEAIYLDYWGHLFYYAGLQFFQKAIEKAGTLDNGKIRDIMATNTFNTSMGPVRFENGMLIGYTGQMGQWQNGVFEVIDAGPKRTAAPVYPKPAWTVDTSADTDSATDVAGTDTATDSDDTDTGTETADTGTGTEGLSTTTK